MNFGSDLQQKLSKINNYIDKNHIERTDTERILLKSAKLTEEVGEFYNELLIHLGYTRKSKAAISEINSELADVILSAMILAQELDINIFSEIENKIDIIYKRFNLDK